MSNLIGVPAPDFTTAAVLGDGTIVEDFSLSATLQGKYGVVFFYPLDFTFVCPSELIAVDHRVAAFRKLNTEVIGVSIDSQFTHNAWRNKPVQEGGIGPVQYTLAADIKHEIMQAYGVASPAGVALRGVFIIDRDRVVRSQIINDLPLGRNFDEVIRLIEALQFHEQHGEVCPAGWQKGDAGMAASPDGVADYLAQNSDKL